MPFFWSSGFCYSWCHGIWNVREGAPCGIAGPHLRILPLWIPWLEGHNSWVGASFCALVVKWMKLVEWPQSPEISTGDPGVSWMELVLSFVAWSHGMVCLKRTRPCSKGECLQTVSNWPQVELHQVGSGSSRTPFPYSSHKSDAFMGLIPGQSEAMDLLNQFFCLDQWCNHMVWNSVLLSRRRMWYLDTCMALCVSLRNSTQEQGPCDVHFTILVAGHDHPM